MRVSSVSMNAGMKSAVDDEVAVTSSLFAAFVSDMILPRDFLKNKVRECSPAIHI